MINGRPVKSKPTSLSPKSISQDVGIVIVKEGRVDATTSNSLNAANNHFLINFTLDTLGACYKRRNIL